VLCTILRFIGPGFARGFDEAFRLCGVVGVPLFASHTANIDANKSKGYPSGVTTRSFGFPVGRNDDGMGILWRA
jgi:hypothetical protein